MDSGTSEQATLADSQRPTSSGQGSRKHVDSRPGHKHSKPWTARLYRKHDAKHHRAEPEAAPLLSDPEPEEPEDEPGPEPELQERSLRGFYGHVHHYLKSAVDGMTAATGWALRKIGSSFSKTARGVANGANSATTGTKKAGRAVRDNPKRTMAVILVLLSITSAILGACLAYDRVKLHPTRAEMCTSPTCIKASNYILQNLDPSLVNHVNSKALEFMTADIDPCTDFDKFVCGGFTRRYDLREDQGDISTGTLIAEDNEFVFKHIVELPRSKIAAKDATLMKMLKTAYTACMDSSQDPGLKPLKDVVDHIKELIPIAGPSRGDTRRLHGTVLGGGNVIKGLNEALTFLVKVGVDALIKLEVMPGLVHPDKHIVKISPVLAIGLPAPDFYRDAELVTEYRRLASQMLKLFYEVHVNSTSILGRHRNIHAGVLDLAQGVIDMEVKLALALPLRQDLVGAPSPTNEVPFSKIETAVHGLDLENVIKALAPASYQPDHVYVTSPAYLDRLSFVLQATPVEVIQAFMSWKAIQHLSHLIDDPKLEPLKAFKAKLKGAAQLKPVEPWRHCVREVNDMLGWAMSRFFAKQAWNDDKLDVSKDVASRIQDALGSLLGDLDWLADGDKEVALEKITNANIDIGYPSKNPILVSPGSLEDYYTAIKLNNSHFANKLEAARFKAAKGWSKLAKNDAAQWDIFADAVDSYYDYPSNKAVFPAGLLQAPMLFDDSVPSYMIYGLFGFAAARELSLAVGSVGSHFVPGGKIRDWWSNQTRHAYDDKSKCFDRQYAKFGVEGPNKVYKVNGNSTLAENIADAAGLQTAFLAWQKADLEEPAKSLPGLQKYTKDQLFFISFGNGLCSKTSPEKAAQRIMTDTFAPNPARILGTVANSKEFREAFECSAKKPTCELF